MHSIDAILLTFIVITPLKKNLKHYYYFYQCTHNIDMMSNYLIIHSNCFHLFSNDAFIKLKNGIQTLKGRCHNFIISNYEFISDIYFDYML